MENWKRHISKLIYILLLVVPAVILYLFDQFQAAERD